MKSGIRIAQTREQVQAIKVGENQQQPQQDQQTLIIQKHCLQIIKKMIPLYPKCYFFRIAFLISEIGFLCVEIHLHDPSKTRGRGNKKETRTAALEIH